MVAELLAPYQHARALQAARWDAVRDALDPETAAVIDRNLAIIQAATADLINTLERTPQDPQTRALLDRTLSHELTVYQQISRIALDSRAHQQEL